MLLFSNQPTYAFKPAQLKTIQKFYNKNKSLSVEIEPLGYQGIVTVKTEKKQYKWKIKISLPDTTIVTSADIVFIGGYGNPGIELGRIYIYTAQGENIKNIDLKLYIPNLTKMSKDYRRICCPFPWVHKVNLDININKLFINVCNKIQIGINLDNYVVNIKE